MRKSTKKVTEKAPRRKRATIQDRIDNARLDGQSEGRRQEFEVANNRGVTHAVQLNAKLHGVLSQLAGLAREVGNTTNQLAEIIRENTPTPRSTL